MRWYSRSSSRSRTPWRRRCRALLERIVEAREHRGAVRSISDVDEAHHLRPDEPPETDASHEVQVVDRDGARGGEDLPRVDERRDLELGHDVEKLASHGERAQLHGAEEPVGVHEAVGAEAT